MKDISIKIPPDNPQELILSNGNATHYSCESNKDIQRKWHGLIYDGCNYLTNIWFTDQTNLLINEIDYTILFPEKIEVIYRNNQVETVFLPDDENAIVYQFRTTQSEKLSFQPYFTMRSEFLSSSKIDDFTITTENGVFYITSKQTDYIALMTIPEFDFEENKELINQEFQKDKIRNDGAELENIYSPGIFTLKTDECSIVAGIGETKAKARAQAEKVITRIDALIVEKRMRLEKFVQSSVFNGNMMNYPKMNLDIAYAWNIISLDKLTMNRFGPGLYAGYHWFDNYWGRDTFIAFEGALLALGRFQEAKQTLLNMKNYQNKNSEDYSYGRTPNLVRDKNTEPNYSTADGTGWYVYAIRKYLELTADKEFAIEILPSVELAIEGELSRTDKHGFVTHRDRETWMDAKTDRIIQTPRGNRAIEIQALFFQMYETLIFITQFTGLESRLGSETNLRNKRSSLLKLIKNYFFSDSLIVDHLNSDGTSNTQKRPNVFLALRLLPDKFLNSSELSSLFEQYKELISDNGIRTLEPSDPDYKPTHDGGTWHHDVAYHNGDVWPWLSGSVIDLAVKNQLFDIPQHLLHILTESTIANNPAGGIGEIFDGNNGLTSVGAVFQLWSMAEFIRSLTYTTTGFSINPIENQIIFAPHGINYFDNFSTSIPIKDHIIQFSYYKITQERFVIENLPSNYHVKLTLPPRFVNMDPVFEDRLEAKISKVDGESLEISIGNIVNPIVIKFNQIQN